jgi:hypothetical protein
MKVSEKIVEVAFFEIEVSFISSLLQIYLGGSSK